MSRPGPSRLGPGDLLRAGAVGLRTRRLRTLLSALGIAIGIASMVGVLGISESSRADLIAALDRLGTNLLRVQPGQQLFTGEDARLPADARAMIRRIRPVEAVAGTASVDGSVRRTDRIPEAETGGISILASDTNLLSTLRGSMREGRFLDEASGRLPAVVLGAVAAERLGVKDLSGTVRVWLGRRWFTVVGVMDPVPLAPDLDRSALVGFPAAQHLLGHDGSTGTLFVRATPESVEDVHAVLAATANPEHPEEVEASRPSDALAARAAATRTFTSLFLGLGAVALLVGGVGIANVMVVSVMERRGEIGLRRALGAARRHVAGQFLTEALLLSALGGLGGAALGVGVTAAYAASRGWSFAVPWVAPAGGVAAAVLIGAVAGVYPAMRAARLSPTEALRSG